MENRTECGAILRNESGQNFLLCLQCNCEFSSFEFFVRHRTAVHGAIQLQSLQQEKLDASLVHGVTHIQQGAINSQPLRRSVAHGAIISQQFNRSVVHGAINSQQLERGVTQGAIKQCGSVAHEAAESHPLQQSGRILPKKTRQQAVIKLSDATVTRTTLAKKSSPIPANYSSTVHGAIPLRPLHTSVAQGVINSQQCVSVEHEAVKLHPLRQSGRILPENTGQQAVIKRSDAATTRTTLAKKSSGQFKCKKCQKKCKSLRRLYAHSDNCQPLATISCDYCSKTYRTMRALRNHMHLLHRSELPFICDACPKAFNMPSELTLHRRIHGTATTIRCDFCDERFFTKFERAAHVRRDHPNEKYRCSKCLFESKVMKVVKRHQSVAHAI